MSFIYLDYNATTPLHPEVLEVMQHALAEAYGNPSSPHQEGARARRIVGHARKQVAELLGCDTTEIVFTSGGSESNNFAIKGIARKLRDQGNHIVTSAIEHPAVEKVCRYLEEEGFVTTFLPVDRQGLVNPGDLERSITGETVLVTVMHANNETGAIQPIEALTRIARDKGVLFHTDAAQSLGKIPVRVKTLGVDLLSVAGHKLYAPKGVGALYIREGIELCPLIHGAGHESGRRAGTENVAAIAGLGKACELAHHEEERRRKHALHLRDRLHRAIRKEIPEASLNGPEEARLPNTLSLSFPGLMAPDIIDALDGIAGSAGSACHARGVAASKVLLAMGSPMAQALGTVRLSVGHFTTDAEVDLAARQVIDAVHYLKKQLP
ncbi:MAG: cysteine desulfurase family protein [Planctomycetota bacterium]